MIVFIPVTDLVIVVQINYYYYYYYYYYLLVCRSAAREWKRRAGRLRPAADTKL